MPSIARADTVGSLLRPSYLREARQAVREGRGSPEALREAEDRAVLANIAAQEEAGLDVITDGEARRLAWAPSVMMLNDASFIPALSGTSFVSVAQSGWNAFWRDDSGNRLASGPTGGSRAVVTQRLTPQRDIVQDEYAFLKAHTRLRTKYCFPAPSFHRTYWSPEHSTAAYASIEDYLRAVRDYIRSDVIDRAVALGCDYIQLDAPNYGQTYTDPEVRAVFQAEGHDLDAELAFDAELDNSVFEGLTGVTRAIHVCRGNRSGGFWSASGGYDSFGPAMFPRLGNVDTLLLEYDSPRAGDFSPLRDVLPQTTVVLGLVTTKHGELESPADLEARIGEASAFLPLERLALSSQCGFASGEAGNPLSAEQQQAKLRLVAETARRVWTA